MQRRFKESDVLSDSGSSSWHSPSLASPTLWMTRLLWAAGIYNIFWGFAVVCWPKLVAGFLGLTCLSYPEVWQYVGFLTAAFGAAYLVASADPLRHWPIVLVGLVSKIIGPLGFAQAALASRLPWRFGWTVFANDIVWWIPFAFILNGAYDAFIGARRTTSPEIQEFALRVRTTAGISLLEMSRQHPVLLYFLRHSGCPFCRDSLVALARQRQQIEANGAQIVFVHMASEHHAMRFLARYGLADLPRVSDPQRALYRAFGLGRGGLWQLIGPHLWLPGLRLIWKHGHSLSSSGGDLFQMPGVFFVFQGQALRSFMHQTAADRPDFLELTQLPA